MTIPSCAQSRSAMLVRASLAALLLCSATLHAQTDYIWTPSQNPATPGGTGAWNTTNQFWNDGADNFISYTDWALGDPSNYVPGSRAVFNGTGGTVTFSQGVGVPIVVNTNGYTFTGSGLTRFTPPNAPSLHLSDGVTLGLNDATATGSQTITLTGNITAGTGAKIVLQGNQTGNNSSSFLLPTGSSNISAPFEVNLTGAGFATFSGGIFLSTVPFTSNIHIASNTRVRFLSNVSNGRNMVVSGNITGSTGEVWFGSVGGVSDHTRTTTLDYAGGSWEYTGVTRIVSSMVTTANPDNRVEVSAANIFPTATELIFGDPTVTGRGGILDLRANVQVGNLSSLAGSSGAIQNRAASGTSILTVGGSAAGTFELLIEDGPEAGAIGLTRSGSGTTTLTANNSYSGATLVTGTSTLVINGDQSGATGTFTVDLGATVAGSGTIGGAATINGTLAPGNSEGLLSFASSLALGSTATVDLEINGASSRGGDYDAVDIGTSLAYDGDLVLTLSGTYTPTTTWNLFDFNSFSGSFDSVTLDGSYIGSLSLFGDIWSGNIGGEDWEFNQATGNLSVVPEPSTWVILTISLLSLTILRHRRSAQHHLG